MIEVPQKVKEALKEGAYRKNYKLDVLRSNGTVEFSITNDNLVSESVTIEERMSSSDVPTFGSGEGSSIEFQYFGLSSIKGRVINTYIECEYKDTDGVIKWYLIPMGVYTIDQCSKQASTGIIKATGYNGAVTNDSNTNIVSSLRTYTAIGDTPERGSISIGNLNRRVISGYEPKGTYTYMEPSAGADTSPWVVNRAKVINPSTGGLYEYATIVSFRASIFYTIDVDLNDYYALFFEYKSLYDDFYNTYKADIERYNFYYADESASDPYYYDTKAYHERMFGGGFSCKTDTTYNYNGYVDSGIHAIMGGMDYSDGQRGTAISEVTIEVPFFFQRYAIGATAPMPTDAQKAEARTKYLAHFNNVNNAHIRRTTYSEIEKTIVSAGAFDSITSVTLKEYLDAVFQLNGLFCSYKRTSNTDIRQISLTSEHLSPADTLYPDNGLYPVGNSDTTEKSVYSTLWTEENNVHKWRNINLKYVNRSGAEATISQNVNLDGTDDIDISDNWWIKNLRLNELEAGRTLRQLANKIAGNTWFPFEMWCTGLPYLEVGDEIEIVTDSGTYTSYIFQRTIKGIQDLQDTYINGSLNIF